MAKKPSSPLQCKVLDTCPRLTFLMHHHRGERRGFFVPPRQIPDRPPAQTIQSGSAAKNDSPAQTTQPRCTHFSKNNATWKRKKRPTAKLNQHECPTPISFFPSSGSTSTAKDGAIQKSGIEWMPLHPNPVLLAPLDHDVVGAGRHKPQRLPHTTVRPEVPTASRARAALGTDDRLVGVDHRCRRRTSGETEKRAEQYRKCHNSGHGNTFILHPPA